MSEEKKEVSTNLFQRELQDKVSTVLSEDKVKTVIDAAEKYFGVNNTVNGKHFFQKYILDSVKDYSSTSAKYFQALTELKSRLGRIFDETIEFQKMEIEKETIALDMEDLQDNIDQALLTNDRKKIRRAELSFELVKQDLLKKTVRAAFAKDSLNNLGQEIEDFKSLCDEYMATGEVVPFEQSRVEDMENKSKMLFLAHTLGTKVDFSPSELAFFMQADGTIRPPEGCEDSLLRLGRPDLAQRIEHTRALIDNANQMRLENKVPEMAQIEPDISIVKK